MIKDVKFMIPQDILNSIHVKCYLMLFQKLKKIVYSNE